MSRLHIIYTEIVLYNCIVLYCKCKKVDIKVWLKSNEWGKKIGEEAPFRRCKNTYATLRIYVTLKRSVQKQQHNVSLRR